MQGFRRIQVEDLIGLQVILQTAVLVIKRCQSCIQDHKLVSQMGFLQHDTIQRFVKTLDILYKGLRL